MSKKLVKTAKQQFEERLRQLHTFVEQVIDKDMYFYGCMDADFDFYVLYSDADKEFYECRYGRQFEDVMQSEEFLLAMVRRFDEGARKIRPLFEWYASADHEINEAAPLDFRDVANIGIEKEFITFQDVEIEVEDEPKIITAREKWEAASIMAKTLWSSDAETVKVEQTDSFVRFFRSDDILSCYEYPSLEEMRKDESFAVRIIDVLVESCQTNRLADFLKWTKSGGAFPLPIEIIFHSEFQGYKFTEYEDDRKESPKQDFKEELDALRTKMVAHIEQLCEQGMTLNMEVLCRNYILTWTDRSFLLCEEIEDCWIAKDDKGEWNLYRKERDGEWDSGIGCFTVETLQNIIEALQ